MGRLDGARWGAIAPAALIAFSLLWRLPMLGDPPWLNDEGTYATVGHAIVQGEALYRQIWENKPPAIYLLYGAVDRLGGPAHLLFGARLLALLAALAAQIAVYRLARQSSGAAPALLAAAVAGVGLDLPLLDGTAANAEIFVAAGTSIGMALLWRGAARRAAHRPDGWRLLYGAGNAFGAALLFKFPAGADLLAALATILVVQQPGERVRGVLTLLLGAATLPILAAAWLLSRGLLGDALYATIGYNRGYVATGQQQHATLTALTLLLVPLAIIALGAIVATKHGEAAIAQSPPAAADQRLFGPFTCWWLGGALIGAMASGRMYPHYALQAVPPLALTAALLPRRPARMALYTVLSLWVIGVPLASLLAPRGDQPGARAGSGQQSYYVNSILHAIGAIDDAAYGFRLDPRVERNLAVVRYLIVHPAGPKSLYIWGNAPWIYYLSGYQHAARFISSFYNPPISGGTAGVLRALTGNPPAYIVVLSPRLPTSSGIDHLLKARYDRVWAHDGAEVFRLR